MSFLVRQVALRSDGSEIVRPSEVDGDTISIGRNAENGVHLPDLAVDPVHASIRREGADTLLVTSEGGLKFRLDGRAVSEARIDLARGGEIGIGGHRVQIERDAESGRAVLTVRRVEALADSEEERDLGTVYTLKGLIPGKRVSAWGFALLVVAACLVWPLYSWATFRTIEERPQGFHADTLWSSGKLSLAHADLKDDCQACHVDAFVSVRDESCLSCHEDDAHEHAPLDRQLASKGELTGLARVNRMVAASFGKPAGRCVDCHTEHEGAGVMPATQQRFCTECHDGMDERLTDTKLLNAADFGKEHPQFQPAVMVDPGAGSGKGAKFRRVSLDRKPTEFNGLKFPHDLHLSRSGGVAQMGRRLAPEHGFGPSIDCADCHKPSADGVRFEPVDMEASCQMCHSLTFEMAGGTFRSLPHGKPEAVKASLIRFFQTSAPPRPANLGSTVRRRPGEVNDRRTAIDYARAVRFRPTRADEAVRAVFSRDGACYDCHIISGGNGGSLNFEVQPVSQTERYFHKGWFDHRAHEEEDCGSCHAAVDSDEATDLLIPGIETCRDCHVGEGGGALTQVSDPVESSCAMCHEYHMKGGVPWQLRVKDKQMRGADPRTVAGKGGQRTMPWEKFAAAERWLPASRP